MGSDSGPTTTWARLVALGLVVASVGFFLARREFEAPRSSAPAGPPSIVLVLIDTLRADYLGSYGFDGDVSPSLDRIAEESIVFEHAFSQAPWTKPSIASLFTSLHPEQHGVVAHGKRYGGDGDVRASALPRRAATLAELLRGAGYETVAFIANPWIQRRLGFAQGFEIFDTEQVGNRVPAKILLDKAREWLAERDPTRPFFLYLHLMDVHGPYDAPRADYEAILGSAGLGESRPLTRAEAATRRGYLMRGGGTHGDDLALDSWRASYAAGVRSVDRQLGAFFEELRRGGVLDDALLVVTSDHGEELADHGGWDHGGSLFEEQIRIPLIVRMPGGLRRGQRVERVVSLVDVMPTLLGVAGARAPEVMAGEDLGPLLAGGDLDGPGAAFASGVKWKPDVKAVRTLDRKLIRGEEGRAVVYDLSTDPREAAGVPLPADDAATLEALLAAHAESLATGPSFRTQAKTMSPGTRDKLRALGYLEQEPVVPKPQDQEKNS